MFIYITHLTPLTLKMAKRKWLRMRTDSTLPWSEGGFVITPSPRPSPSGRGGSGDILSAVGQFFSLSMA